MFLGLSLFETVKNHRRLWSWIARETEKREEIVFKDEFFEVAGMMDASCPRNCCYACDFVKSRYREACLFRHCSECPFAWRTISGETVDGCIGDNSIYTAWKGSSSWKEAAELAYMIANLPLKECYKEQYRQEKHERQERRKEAEKLCEK